MKMTERERLIELILSANISLFRTDKSFAEVYADYLLENGVVALPCKVGTPLYFLSGNLEKCEIIESSTWSYIIDSFGVITIEETLHELSYKNNYEYTFGSTVFSTYEEAEKALYKI